MALSVIVEKGKVYPVFVCDTCHEPIDDLSEGIITFNDIYDKPFGQTSGIYHKGECDPKRHGRKDAKFWRQLDKYMFQLFWNQKVGRREITGKSSKKLTIEMDFPEDLMA